MPDIRLLRTTVITVYAPMIGIGSALQVVGQLQTRRIQLLSQTSVHTVPGGQIVAAQVLGGDADGKYVDIDAIKGAREDHFPRAPEKPPAAGLIT